MAFCVLAVLLIVSNGLFGTGMGQGRVATMDAHYSCFVLFIDESLRHRLQFASNRGGLLAGSDSSAKLYFLLIYHYLLDQNVRTGTFAPRRDPDLVVSRSSDNVGQPRVKPFGE